MILGQIWYNQFDLQSKSNCKKKQLNSINAEIKTFFFTQKQKSVRKNIVPGNSRSLWYVLTFQKILAPMKSRVTCITKRREFLGRRLLTALLLTWKRR